MSVMSIGALIAKFKAERGRLVMGDGLRIMVLTDDEMDEVIGALESTRLTRKEGAA